MRILVKYLVARKGHLYFRRRVPEQLVSVLDKREFKKALGLAVGSERLAAAGVERLTRLTDELLKKAEAQTGNGLGNLELADQAFDWARARRFLNEGEGLEGGPYERSNYEAWLDDVLREALLRSGKRHEDELVQTDFPPATWAKIETVKQGDRLDVSPTIRDALRSYTDRHKSGDLPKAEAAAIDQYVEFAGDQKLADIRRADARDWMNYLIDTRQQSGGTVRRRLNSINAVVNRAIEDFELNLRSPFEKQKLPKAATQAREKRMPFNKAHLARISSYLDQHRCNLETETLIRLLMHTTCRPAEAAGLDWDDVHLDHDVPHIMLRPNEWRGLKTLASERDNPLTPEAKQALERWRDHTKAGKTGAVFGETCRDSSSLSQRLNKAIRTAGVPKSERLVSYSFRHGFKEALRQAGVSDDLQRHLTGHSDSSASEAYGAGKPALVKLQGAVQAAVPYLGDVDDRNYRAHELITEDVSG